MPRAGSIRRAFISTRLQEERGWDGEREERRGYRLGAIESRKGVGWRERRG